MNNIEEEISEIISEAERILESDGNYSGAIELLSWAEQRLLTPDSGIGDESFFRLLSSILGHRAVYLKLWYDSTGNDYLLEKLDITVYRGINLKISDSDKATFYLRFGDLEMIRNNLINAEKQYRKAYELVILSGRIDKSGEFLGNWAASLTNLNRPKEAVKKLREALKSSRAHPVECPWHNLNIISGHYRSLAKACLKAGKYGTSIRALWKYWHLADILDKKYQKPERKKQFYSMFKK
jgi:tetratricopeptide (TPR) repeat protein